ncbi:MAG: Hpt domain-containing protein [Polyangiales bacterium]
MGAPLEDPELWEVFREEMTRHVAALSSPGASAAAWRGAMHSIRGAASMMGLDALAEEVADLEDALRGRDGDAARRGVGALERRLLDLGVDAKGLGALLPPEAAGDTLRPSSPPTAIDPSEGAELYGYFLSDAHSRLDALRDEFALARGAADRAEVKRSLDASLRLLHALKGASAMAGAPGISRAAHALEGAVQAVSARSGTNLDAAFAALERARAQLAVAVGNPDGGESAAGPMVDGLRAAGLLRARDVPGKVTASAAPRSSAEGLRVDEHVRVAMRTVAQLSEAVGEVAFVRSRVDQGAEVLHELSRALAQRGQDVDDALRRIGPARPWGVPAEVIASLRRVGDGLRDASARIDTAVSRARRHGDALGRSSERARELLRGAGEVNAGWIFDRVAPAAQLSAAGDRLVRVLRRGDEVAVDRALAEPLVDVLSQLVRNAVAHGVERPATRLARSKPATAALRLEARAEGDAVYFAVEDDGAGIDLDAVRDRAEQLGHLPRGARATPQEVLETLFIPGVSTRLWAAPEAGRGVGLDLVRESVRQLGGVVRASTQRGVGSRFEVEVEARPIAQRLLPVRLHRRYVMVPLARVLRVQRAADTPGAMSLAALLGDERGSEGVALHLRTAAGPRWVAAPETLPPVELVVRPLPRPLDRGPWRGAAIDGAGRVVLVMDPDRLPP